MKTGDLVKAATKMVDYKARRSNSVELIAIQAGSLGIIISEVEPNIMSNRKYCYVQFDTVCMRARYDSLVLISKSSKNKRACKLVKAEV